MLNTNKTDFKFSKSTLDLGKCSKKVPGQIVAPAQFEERCGKTKPRKSLQNSDSFVTLTIQDLEFPKNLEKKPNIPVSTEHSDTKLNAACSEESTTQTLRSEGIVKSTPMQQCPFSKSKSPTISPLQLSQHSAQDVSLLKTTGSRNVDDAMKKLNSKWKKPCDKKIPRDTMNFIGACSPNYEMIAKLPKAKQKFLITQDPRKSYCLRVPKSTMPQKAVTKMSHIEEATKLMKLADNTCDDIEKTSSESTVCEVIDLENPLKLDFHGLDYRDTYQADERKQEDQRVFYNIDSNFKRKIIQRDTVKNTEKEFQRQRIKVPEYFKVEIGNDEMSSISSGEMETFVKLYRTRDKAYNKKILEQHQQQRVEHFKQLYLKRKAKCEDEVQKNLKEQSRADALAGITLVSKNFKKVADEINKSDESLSDDISLFEEHQKSKATYPITMAQLRRFKENLQLRNRMHHDEAVVKKNFFLQRKGKEKSFPEADLKFGDESIRLDNSENVSQESSDDEDDFEVGKKGNVVKLRGFHYKKGGKIRGKNALYKGRSVKGCMTREEWMEKLAPKKIPVKIDPVADNSQFQKQGHSESKLFDKVEKYKPSKMHESAIRQFIAKRLGRQYLLERDKKRKIVKPHVQYNIKRFDLIKFIFGEDKKAEKRKFARSLEVEAMAHKSTKQYMEDKERDRRALYMKSKQQRLQFLGIPCQETEQEFLKSKCESYEIKSLSGWVPKHAPEIIDFNEDPDKFKETKIPVRLRGNMPAPDFRETTLKRNARYPRDYTDLRVPSVIFDEVVKTSAKPYLKAPPPDAINFANVREVSKRQILFQNRHHHDHSDPAQTRLINVHYQAKIQKPVVSGNESTVRKSEKKPIQFSEAYPTCNDFVEMDLTLTKPDTSAMISKRRHEKSHLRNEFGYQEHKNICSASDFYKRSRPSAQLKEVDFPGRQEYLDFLYEVRNTLFGDLLADKESEQLLVDKQALIKELEEDLKSIESCLSSLSSSQCTNFTNDSGSQLILVDGTKIPMDYIRKSIIPFEEFNRSRFQVVPRTKKKKNVFMENDDPPFKENFFTFTTRLRNDLRFRLEVPVEDVRKLLIGKAKNKHPGLVATDIDEFYAYDANKSPTEIKYGFRSVDWLTKNGLRLKYESMLIQGQIVRQKIYDRLNDQHWENMDQMPKMFDALFAKWQKRAYQTSMNITQEIKSYYLKADELKKVATEVGNVHMMLKMSLMFIETLWRQRIMLQNFHYLLGDETWRHENDWMHRVAQDKNELESYDVSIAKRPYFNMRSREKDNARDIKLYYENVYYPNRRPLLIVFPDADAFLQGIDNLTVKTFLILLEMHYTLAIHSEIAGRILSFKKWCEQDLKSKEQFVAIKCGKKYFMEDRLENIVQHVETFMVSPFSDAYVDQDWNRNRGILFEVWLRTVPESIRGASDQVPENYQMVSMLVDIVLDLLGKFERFPYKMVQKIRADLKAELNIQKIISKKACQTEKRIVKEMKKVRQNFEPIPAKLKRVGKLPRYYLKKKESVYEELKRNSSLTSRNYLRAFYTDGIGIVRKESQSQIVQKGEKQKQDIPFYFDHFLSIHGYVPKTDFKTKIEMHDGPEVDRMQLQKLVPDILKKLDNWQQNKERVKKQHILMNPQMYKNVV